MKFAACRCFPPVAWMAILLADSPIPSRAGDPGTVVATAWDYWDFSSPDGVNPTLTNIVAGSVRSNALFVRVDGTVFGLSGASNVVAVAAGYSHNAALLGDGTVRQWPPTAQPPVPVDLTNVVALAAGSRFTCALQADGRVVVWGANAFVANVPPNLTNVIRIAAGRDHLLALTASGQVVAWGFNNAGQTNVPAAATNMAFIAAVGATSAAATSNGVVWSWGENRLPSRVDTARPLQQLAATRNRPWMLDTHGNLVRLGSTLPGWNVTNLAGIFASESNLYAIARGPVIRSRLSPPQFPPEVESGGFGANWAFAATAQSYHPFIYQWFFNGDPLPGADTPFLRLTGLNATNSGLYFLMVTNAYGTMTSAPVTLNIPIHCDEAVSPAQTTNIPTPATFGLPPALPPGFVYSTIPSRSPSPVTSMAFAPDGRLFVCEQRGSIWIVNSTWPPPPPRPFATLTYHIDSSENGLLGIAFDPGFETNSYLYVHYTLPKPDLHSRISRLTADGNVMKPCSENILLEIEFPTTYNHRGGALHFGPDGKLYAGIGDHWSGWREAESLNSLVGKILRINPDGSIPEDNPFYDIASGPYRAIWALGLRNPFTFAIHRRTGRMLINDVGARWEEVNEGLPGANYGWPYEQGNFETNIHTNPVYSYLTEVDPGNGCAGAITGAAFYDPPRRLLPAEYVGGYFFADFCKGWIRRLDTNGVVHNFASNIVDVVDIDVGPDGALYGLTYGGTIYRFAVAPSRFVSAEQLIDGRVHLRVTGVPNQPYILEYSTALENWQPLSTNQSATSPFDLYDPEPPNTGQRFYRLRD